MNVNINMILMIITKKITMWMRTMMMINMFWMMTMTCCRESPLMSALSQAYTMAPILGWWQLLISAFLCLWQWITHYKIYSIAPYRLAFLPAVVLTCSCTTFKWSTFRMSLEAKHLKCFLCFVCFFFKRTHTFI